MVKSQIVCVCVWVSLFAHFDFNVFSHVTDISSSHQISFIYLCVNISHPSSQVLHALTKADDDFSRSLGFLKFVHFFLFVSFKCWEGLCKGYFVFAFHQQMESRTEFYIVHFFKMFSFQLLQS